ncbi:MAG: ABC transporter permease [Chthoniobacteraceae bacterium]
MTIRSIWNAIASVALKEFLHVWRDKRILALIIVLPPFFTLLFGYAFEATDLTGVPAAIIDRDHTEHSERLAKLLGKKKTFAWKKTKDTGADPDLLRLGVSAALVIPKDWTSTLEAGNPMPLRLFLDGTDATSAEELEGRLREMLGEFQGQENVQELTVKPLLDELPSEVFDALKAMKPENREKLKVEFQKLVKPWQPDTRILYNPGLRFIDYVMPGIIGLILQLLTVTLMACTIAREREAGTLAQLIVTPLRRTEIVIGKVVPYLGISLFLIAVTIGVAHFHFGVHFRQHGMLALLCLLFLLCSLGSGLLISAFCQTQTQAIQFAVFYLLPVFPLSGAFAPIERLPVGVRAIAEVFPLTHFCEAFRMASLRNAGFSFFAGDLLFLAIGAVLTCGGAAWILSRTDA